MLSANGSFVSHCSYFVSCMHSRSSPSLTEKKKNAHHESCELSFIWGKMRTRAWEETFQRALRNCSKEVAESQYICDFSEGGSTFSHTYILQKDTASHEEQASLGKMLVLF